MVFFLFLNIHIVMHSMIGCFVCAPTISNDVNLGGRGITAVTMETVDYTLNCMGGGGGEGDN